jgi:nucleotide-binding universal stress UspA family protein
MARFMLLLGCKKSRGNAAQLQDLIVNLGKPKGIQWEVKMNILVGYNGSNEAKDALKLAQMHAKGLGAKIEVASAISRWDPLEYHKIQENEQELNQEVKEILNGDNALYQTHLLVNNLSPGDQLVKFAKRYHVDEIIIGAPKRTRVGKLLLGSTAQYIVLNAPCPVVTVN